jgi:hypothetical protein
MDGELMENCIGRDHPAPRHRKQVTPIPSRTGRRYRALPISDHSPYVEGQTSQAKQGQAVHQGHQLQPLDDHTLHARVGGIERGCYCRYFQGGFSTGGCEEDCQKGVGREIHVRKEQMVLHPFEYVLGFRAAGVGNANENNRILNDSSLSSGQAGVLYHGISHITS